MRQSWNFRRNPRGRPHCLQRLRLRAENFGFRSALTIIEVLAIDVSLLAERHSELAQKKPRLLVILRRGDDGDVHALRLVDLARIDLRKDQVVANAEGVIAAPVERLRRHAAEVADARKSDVDQTIEKLVHLVAAQRDHRADGLPFAELEAGDRLLRLGDHRLLSGDRGQLLDGGVEDLGVLNRLADAHVQDDFLDLRNRHRVPDLELVLEFLPDFVRVQLFDSRCHCWILLSARRCTSRVNDYLPRSALHLRQKRTASPSSLRCEPRRAASLQLGQTTCSLATWIGDSRSRMPPLTFLPGFGRVCFFVKFTRSTMAVPFVARTRSTRPFFPASLPESTTPVSPLRTCGWWIGSCFCFDLLPYMCLVPLDHFRRERDDLHELALTKLAGDGSEHA